MHKTLYVAPGLAQCRLYLMPYPMKPGQHPEDIHFMYREWWEEVGLLNAELKVVWLDVRLHHLHSEIEGNTGGSYFELDEDHQFYDGPPLQVNA